MRAVQGAAWSVPGSRAVAPAMAPPAPAVLRSSRRSGPRCGIDRHAVLEGTLE